MTRSQAAPAQDVWPGSEAKAAAEADAPPGTPAQRIHHPRCFVGDGTKKRNRISPSSCAELLALRSVGAAAIDARISTRSDVRMLLTSFRWGMCGVSQMPGVIKKTGRRSSLRGYWDSLGKRRQYIPIEVAHLAWPIDDITNQLENTFFAFCPSRLNARQFARAPREGSMPGAGSPSLRTCKFTPHRPGDLGRSRLLIVKTHCTDWLLLL